MPTYPLATLGPTLTSAGIQTPTYDEIFQSLQTSFQQIYGTDAYIAPDSKDGQLLAIFAKGQHDANQALVDLYNSISPTTAQGVALSSRVSINGISRLVATNSQVTVTVVGEAGVVINNGLVKDTDGGATWALPSVVTIPPAGEIDVVATCTEEGDIAAGPGTVTKIMTPVRGWQSVTNDGSASQGAPVETDARLKARRKLSVALPSRTILSGILGALGDLDGVLEVQGYENDSDTTDSDGLPEHSISIVIQGGDPQEIAQTILVKKTPGTNTYGNTSLTVTDDFGVPYTIRWFTPVNVPIEVEVDVKALLGYSTVVGDLIKEKVAQYINEKLVIGQDVFVTRLYLPAQLFGGEYSETFEVLEIRIAASPASPAASDVNILFNQVATCVVSDVTVAVIP